MAAFLVHSSLDLAWLGTWEREREEKSRVAETDNTKPDGGQQPET